MNKQPYYHSADCDLSLADIERIKHHEDILSDSVEYYNRELLFTAIQTINENELKIKTDNGICNSPGDPADLV